MAEDEPIDQYEPREDLPDVDIDPVEGGSAPNSNTPSVKGMLIQPFPQGQQGNPIEKFMKGSNKPEEFLTLTNVTAQEVSRHSRMVYFQNIANFANGKMQEVMLYGYNLKRSIDRQTAIDVVAMVSGEKQAQRRDWEKRQTRVMDRARGSNNPLNSSPGMANNAE